ncbi:MAG TPA: FAD-dependent oxidoreductase, partial [Caulobacteraceae bacterium]
MSRTPKKSIASPAPDVSAPDAPTVDVVGGGLAGLTAALRLASCGFKVTLHEATGALGGNLSSECVNGVWHDVYPHMFCDWYSNFWTMFEEDLDLRREEHFEPRMGVKLLNAGATKFIELENATTFKALMANMNSGLASWPDLFLFGFSMLDLAATPFDRSRSDQLEKLDVNGFIYSRGYSTERVAQLQNYILMLIWSIQSDLTAASSYQDFIKHTIAYPKPTPFAWLLKGSLEEKIIAPIKQKLDGLGCEIRLDHEAVKIELNGDKPTVTFRDTSRIAPAPGAAEPRSRDVSAPDYLVIATPAKPLSKLALSGREGRRIVDRLPRLAELRRLRGEAIPVLDLYFTKKLPDIPREQFALGGTDSDMTALDLSQLWTGDARMANQTVLALAASNGCALPALEDAELG